jgi:hypothetical protein
MATFLALAFLATFVLSRLALWLLRKWDGGWLRLAAHAASFALCWAFFTFGSSDGKVYWSGGVIYLFPQALWVLVDYLRGKTGRDI